MRIENFTIQQFIKSIHSYNSNSIHHTKKNIQKYQKNYVPQHTIRKPTSPLQTHTTRMKKKTQNRFNIHKIKPPSVSDEPMRIAHITYE